QLDRLVAFVAGVLEQYVVLRCPGKDTKANLPRPRENVGVLDRRLVIDVVGVDDREPFDDMEGGTVEGARGHALASEVSYHPGLAGEVLHVDHQSVALPAPDRVAHPQLDV